MRAVVLTTLLVVSSSAFAGTLGLSGPHPDPARMCVGDQLPDEPSALDSVSDDALRAVFERPELAPFRAALKMVCRRFNNLIPHRKFKIALDRSKKGLAVPPVFTQFPQLIGMFSEIYSPPLGPTMVGAILCANAAYLGDFATLDWGAKSWTAISLQTAIFYNREAVVQYLIANDCPMDATCCALAAQTNQLDTLKLLHEKKCPVDEKVATQAAANGYFEVLQWAAAEKLPINWAVVLQWARSRFAQSNTADIHAMYMWVWSKAEERRKENLSP